MRKHVFTKGEQGGKPLVRVGPGLLSLFLFCLLSIQWESIQLAYLILCINLRVHFYDFRLKFLLLLLNLLFYGFLGCLEDIHGSVETLFLPGLSKCFLILGKTFVFQYLIFTRIETKVSFCQSLENLGSHFPDNKQSKYLVSLTEACRGGVPGNNGLRKTSFGQLKP